MDFNHFQITPADLRHLMADPTIKPFLQAKLKELYALFKQKYPSLDLSSPSSFLDYPEIGFILSAKALELKAMFQSSKL